MTATSYIGKRKIEYNGKEWIYSNTKKPVEINFEQAIKWLKKGYKVRRPIWEEDSYWELGVDEKICFKGETARVHLNHVRAVDWEIYQEKSKTLNDMNFMKQFEVKEELKQQAIKWINEDFELIKGPLTYKMLERWIKRFNIEEGKL